MQVNPVPSSQHYVQPSVPYPHALLANRRVRDFSRNNERPEKALGQRQKREIFIRKQREYKEGIQRGNLSMTQPFRQHETLWSFRQKT